MNPDEQNTSEPNTAPEGQNPAGNADFNAEGIEIMPSSAAPSNDDFGKSDNETPAAPSEPETGNVAQEVAIDEEPAPIKSTPPLEPIAPKPQPAIQPKPPTNIYKAPPAPEPVVPKVQNDPSIKPLRTFKSDAEEAVKYQNVSAIDIAIAEQKKRESRPPEPKKSSASSQGMFVLVAILVMIIIGGGWYYWFISSQDTVEVNPVPTSVKTILSYAKGSTLYLDPQSQPLVLISSKLAASNAGLGNIYALIPTAGATSTQYAPISEVFRDTRIPSRLLRSLKNEYMVGSYTYDSNGVFIILKGTYFQNVFSGMLEWERTMRDDLLDLVRVSSPNEPDFATSTPFTDAVVSNVDARVLKNEDGDAILMYAFADQDTVVISTRMSALKYVLDRLLSVRTIQ